MPKPYADRAGSGAHFNVSPADRASGANLVFDPSDLRGCKLSRLGYQFVAGVLRQMSKRCISGPAS